MILLQEIVNVSGHTWQQVLMESVIILVPTMGTILKGFHSQKMRAKDAKEEQEKMHLENAKKLDTLLQERQFLRPHDHIETDGDPLTADGIIRRNYNGK